MMDGSEKRGFPWKFLLIGCGGIVVLGVVAVVALLVWAMSGPEGGVKLPNEMDKYALDYLEKHQVLEPGEKLLAYYDVTIRMDGSEAAILTDQRVIHHKEGRSTAIKLAEIRDVQHTKEPLVGDVFLLYGESGDTLRLEIAPLNGGETFWNLLNDARERARQGKG